MIILNYSETIQWILNRLPSYQDKGSKYYKPGLYKIKKFCNFLGNPQKFFKSIHVGGTNGKGSTVNMLYSILQEEGYKSAAFTSPHLTDFRERISYNGNLIEKDFIINFIKKYKFFIEKESLSFFEMNTAMAFQYFKDKSVDIAIIEVGLGGKLDSTNIISPEISIITNISLDHTDLLGSNELSIAREKAGIIKKNLSVIIGNDLNKSVQYFFLKESIKKNAPIYFFSKNENIEIPKYPYFFKNVYYQIFNKKLVLKTINILKSRKNIFISDLSIERGLKNLTKNTNFRGRWQVLNKKNPKIICDIAHNEKGIIMINYQLKKELYNNLHLILGFVKGKKVKSLIKHFPKNSYYYFCHPNIERKYDIEKLKILLKKENFFNKKINFFTSVKKAFLSARKNANKKDLILISGSTFIVSEIFLLL